MKCVTCEYWEATDGDQCEACATTTALAPANVAEVVRAWTVPGPVPAHHKRAKERLSVEWPTLYSSLEKLCGT